MHLHRYCRIDLVAKTIAFKEFLSTFFFAIVNVANF